MMKRFLYWQSSIKQLVSLPVVSYSGSVATATVLKYQSIECLHLLFYTQPYEELASRSRLAYGNPEGSDVTFPLL